jgi:hypothetical protein
MNMSVPAKPGIVILAAGVLAFSADARAQSALPRWEVDVHAGGPIVASNPTGGTPLVQFPVGDPIATGGGTTFSRAVSSWYYGDGARLLNDVNARFGVPGRITPLDTTVTRAIVQRKEGAAVGARVARYLTPRIAIELNVDYAPSELEFNPDVAGAIDATRAAFIPAWRDLLRTGATFNTDVTSTSALADGDGHDITTTGAVRFHFPEYHGFRPYVTGGAGAIAYSGKAPSATLTGQYSFLFANIFPMSERDVTTVSVRTKDTVALGLAGGGFEYDFSPRHGLRADARVEFHPSRVDTVVSAKPSVTPGTPPFAIVTSVSPAIQFSNSTTTGRPSSLSGPEVDELATFTGTGVRSRLRASIGYVIRF